jgi:hypothetical protein
MNTLLNNWKLLLSKTLNLQKTRISFQVSGLYIMLRIENKVFYEGRSAVKTYKILIIKLNVFFRVV